MIKVLNIMNSFEKVGRMSDVEIHLLAGLKEDGFNEARERRWCGTDSEWEFYYNIKSIDKNTEIISGLFKTAKKHARPKT